ncbi:MAG TPA: tetratricopeptide repeat protein [Spirochaetota bacterium]|nr:tetratricopeptide repeat protein [Spirochaetota bacterium]
MKIISILLFLAVASPLAAAYEKYVHLQYIERMEETPLPFLKAKKAESAGQALNGAEYAVSIKEYKMACEDFASAIAAEVDPCKRAFIYTRLGETYLEMKEYHKAIACLANAEGILSKHRSDFEQLHALIPRVYASTSRCYLRWGKIASAAFYLWAANRLFDELGQGDAAKRPFLDDAQKKLVKSSLYAFISGREKPCDDKGTVKTLYASMGEGDDGFAAFRKKARMTTHVYLSPRPQGPMKAGANGAQFAVYTKGGRTAIVEFRDPEADDFNKRICYRDGKPVSSAYESHTYHSTDVKLRYGLRGTLLWVLVISYPTQVNHHGFMPTVNFYSFE